MNRMLAKFLALFLTLSLSVSNSVFAFRAPEITQSAGLEQLDKRLRSVFSGLEEGTETEDLSAERRLSNAELSALVAQLRSKEPGVSQKAFSSLTEILVPRFIRIARDYYYRSRFLSEEMAGVPFTSVYKVEEFTNEAVAALYNQLTRYQEPEETELPMAFPQAIYSGVIRALARLLESRYGVNTATVVDALGKLNETVRHPEGKFADQLRLSKDQVLQALEDKPDAVGRPQVLSILELADQIRRHEEIAFTDLEGKIDSGAFEKIEDPQDDPIRAAQLEFRQRALERVFGMLTYREREILKLRYGLDDGVDYTLEEVGRVFNISPNRVRQIEGRGIGKLRHPLRARQLVPAVEVEPPTPTLSPSERFPVRSSFQPGTWERPMESSRLDKPLSQKEKDELLDYLEQLPPLQQRILPDVLQGLSVAEIVGKFKFDQQEIEDHRRRLLGTLRTWFTFGALDHLGSFDKLKEQLSLLAQANMLQLRQDVLHRRDSITPETTGLEENTLDTILAQAAEGIRGPGVVIVGPEALESSTAGLEELVKRAPPALLNRIIFFGVGTALAARLRELNPAVQVIEENDLVKLITILMAMPEADRITVLQNLFLVQQLQQLLPPSMSVVHLDAVVLRLILASLGVPDSAFDQMNAPGLEQLLRAA